MIRFYIYSVLWLMLFTATAGCSQAQSGKKPAAVLPEKVFTLPQIPPVLISPGDRASYLVAHYWDGFDFSDTTLIARPEITEQAFADFLDVLPHVSPDESVKALRGLMASASVDHTMLMYFTELAGKYLYDPNSPFRNEEFYIPVLEYIVSLPDLAELYKIRPRYRLELALKNRPGDVATDFTYTLSNGKSGRLSGIKSEYTVLFFNNPDCADCISTKAFIVGSALFRKLVLAKRLAVVAVYPDGDLSLWKKTTYPPAWINGSNPALSEARLYDLKAMPTLYLLDKDKRVILKDAPVGKIEEWLDGKGGWVGGIYDL